MCPQRNNTYKDFFSEKNQLHFFSFLATSSNENVSLEAMRIKSMIETKALFKT